MELLTNCLDCDAIATCIDREFRLGRSEYGSQFIFFLSKRQALEAKKRNFVLYTYLRVESVISSSSAIIFF